MSRPQTHRQWTAEEDQLVKSRVADGAGTKAIAAELQRTYKSVEQRIGTLQVQRFRRQPAGVTLSREVVQRHGATVLAPISTSAESDDAFFARALEESDRNVAAAKQERYARLEIVSDRPIAIGLFSDAHVSVRGKCDVRGLSDFAEAFAASPRAYALGVGDMLDNPIKHKPSAVLDIPEDLRLLDLLIGKFQGKLLGMTSGNHDDWTDTFVGVDNLKTMAERHQIHYAKDELVWLVDILSPETRSVTASWVIATRHAYYRHSNLNYTHACWRWLEDGVNSWPHDEKGATLVPDVLAIGHNHVAEVAHRSTQRGTVIACRMGAWQYTSRYTRAGGWTLMPPTAPTVVLPNIRDGVNQPHAYERYQDALDRVK